MLGFAQTGQVGVDGGDHGALMAEVDLDLAEVLALFEQVGRVRMAQGMNVRGLFDAAGLQRKAEGALERGAGHRLGGGAGALPAEPFGGKEQGGMTMCFPQLAQTQECALGQRHVTILIAFALADVEEHAFRIDVAHLQLETLSQTQAAGIEGEEGDAMIQGGNTGQNAPHLRSREDDRQFELGIGANQLELVRPEAFERFLPEQFEGADDLGAGLAGDLLFRLKMNAILAELLGGDQLGRFGIELTELAQTGQVGLFGARADGQKL
jgi:hypothetical protein